MSDIKPFQIERPWGNFRQFTKNESSTVKIITIKPNEELSVQSHAKRAEFWHVVSGTGVWEINNEVFHLVVGDERNVPLGSKHRISAGPFGLQVMEIATGEFDEEDITRYEDKYGRV